MSLPHHVHMKLHYVLWSYFFFISTGRQSELIKCTMIKFKNPFNGLDYWLDAGCADEW